MSIGCNDLDRLVAPGVEDKDPPSVWWSAPKAGATLADTVTISLQFFDDSKIDTIKIFKDGGVVKHIIPQDYNGGTDGTVEFKWNTNLDSDGVHIWEARAWDVTGKIGQSLSLLVRVNNNEEPPSEDKTPPVIVWKAPEQGAVLTGTIGLSFDALDNVGIDSFRIFRNGITAPELLFRSQDNTSFTIPWITKNDLDGNYTIFVRAWDESGNMGRSLSLLVRVRNGVELPPDVTPPVIAWLSPTPMDTLASGVQLRFDVMDVSRLDSVHVLLNGQIWQNYDLSGIIEQNFFDGDVEWQTDEFVDGSYIIQVKAWDTYGNIGLSEVIWFAIWNIRPRTIWVPDDYKTIMDAVWESKDGDTIMVRAGTYFEWVQMFDKNVSLISESGPEATIIDGRSGDLCLSVTGGQDTTMIVRGFTFVRDVDNDSNIISIYGSSPKIVNNIIKAPNFRQVKGLYSGETIAIIRNNLFIFLSIGASISHNWGDFTNNMFVNISRFVIWNSPVFGQPLIPDYNLFWDYNDLIGGSDEITIGEHNIYDSEPFFVGDSYRLRNGSSGIDQGRPDLLDPNGSRSDIGVHGGPYAY